MESPKNPRVPSSLSTHLTNSKRRVCIEKKISIQITLSKIFAGLIACGYIVITLTNDETTFINAIKGALTLLLPLALIWFPQEIGDMTGYLGRGVRINNKTPAFLVSLAGWFILVGIPILLYFLQAA